jgi:hypothetical protein
MGVSIIGSQPLKPPAAGIQRHALLDASDQWAEGRECRSRRQNDAGGNFT